MSQPHTSTTDGSRRAVPPAGRWINDIETESTTSFSDPGAGDADLGLATALLDAVTRMHDSPDPHRVVRVIAEEALRWIPADAVVELGHNRNEPAPLLQLIHQVQDDAALHHLVAQLAEGRSLQPGQVAEVALRRAQHVSTADAGLNGETSRSWLSALVTNLGSDTSSHPTRLLWCSTTAGLGAAGGRAALFARHAGLALKAVTERHSLQQAVESRTTIGQATGILMNRHNVTAARAFELLRRCSQNRNIKTHDIADTLIRTGQFPT